MVSQGSPVLGSSGYTVQCNAVQFPWNSQLIRYRWNNTVDSPLVSNDRLNISLLNATYDSNDRVFVFNSSIQFNPLSFQDAGYITCGLALNLTYPDGPDNSSVVIMNRTTSIITIDGMSTNIYCIEYILSKLYTKTLLVKFTKKEDVPNVATKGKRDYVVENCLVSTVWLADVIKP